MCGPFKGCQGILRLLEIIFSTLSFIIVMFRGRMVSPWGVWCEFVWVFCITVPLALTVMEAKKWNVLLVAFLPDWADLTCGLTALCTTTITSATIIFSSVFLCRSCITSILCFTTSLVATILFLIDGAMQKRRLPSGYLSSPRGGLRSSEAFIGCIILTAATDHFVTGEWAFRPIGMTCSIIVFAVCLLVTVVIIVLHLLKLLKCLVPFKLSIMELVFNIMAVLLYLTALILWSVFGYRRYNYSPYICDKCSFADMHTVTVGASVNLFFYFIDLILSIKYR